MMPRQLHCFSTEKFLALKLQCVPLFINAYAKLCVYLILNVKECQMPLLFECPMYETVERTQKP